VPSLIESIKGKKNIALYYYSFPLDMHPTAKTVIKATFKAKKDGIKDVELKVYKANYEKFYDVYTTREPQKALDAFNKIFSTKYTLKQINTKDAIEYIENDIFRSMEANIQATPTISFNGSFKDSRKNLSKFLDK
jgi:hypothetical protein